MIARASENIASPGNGGVHRILNVAFIRTPETGVTGERDIFGPSQQVVAEVVAGSEKRQQLGDEPVDAFGVGGIPEYRRREIRNFIWIGNSVFRQRKKLA